LQQAKAIGLAFFTVVASNQIFPQRKITIYFYMLMPYVAAT